MSLDNFNHHRTAREYEEHRKLITDTISILAKSESISSIAARGTRLLTELLAEETKYDRSNTNIHRQNGAQITQQVGPAAEAAHKTLDVAAFVKKFCERDQPPPGNSPIGTTNMPLWLQQENSYQPYDMQRALDNFLPNRGAGNTPSNNHRAHQDPHGMSDQGYQFSQSQRRNHNVPVDTFSQAFSDSVDIRSMNWFEDLMGLAPSNSI